MKVFLLSFSFLALSFYSCKPNNNIKNNNPVIVKLPPNNSSANSTPAGKGTFNYDLKTPDRTWKLPAPLVEVSGNTWLDKDHLILIEDLNPDLYLIKIDDKNATLEKTIPFQKDDKDKFDIEDVCMVGDKVYALWSHGSLFEINNWNANPDVTEINTGLTKKNNTEGLCYDPVTHEIYLLSTRDNKCMAVFNREGSLLSFQFIDKDLMPQPEGICFSPEGKLYISSEGKKGDPGNLFEFNVK
jgi:uncharacterized protein YjiK